MLESVRPSARASDRSPPGPRVDPDRCRPRPTISPVAVIACPSCGTRNRVGGVSRGTPRCASCKSPLPWVVDADGSTFAEETTASVPVVVDFWAEWCGPCRMISPVLQELAARHAGQVKVVKVDVDASPGLAQRFQAQSIPLLVVLRDGREVDRIVGAVPRPALESRLAPLLRRDRAPAKCPAASIGAR